MSTEQWLGIDELIENDMTSYEFFNSLSPLMQKRVRQRDFCSYRELAEYVSQCRKSRKVQF